MGEKSVKRRLSFEAAPSFWKFVARRARIS